MRKQASAEKQAGGIGRAQAAPSAESLVEKPIDPQVPGRHGPGSKVYKPSRCQIVVLGPAWFMV